MPELYGARSLIAGLQHTDLTAEIHVKAAAQFAKMVTTGQQLEVNADLDIIGSTELKKCFPYSSA